MKLILLIGTAASYHQIAVIYNCVYVDDISIKFGDKIETGYKLEA